MKRNMLKRLVSMAVVLGVLSCQKSYAEEGKQTIYSNTFETEAQGEELVYDTPGDTSYGIEESSGKIYLELLDEDQSTSIGAGKEFQPVSQNQLSIEFKFMQPNNKGNTDNKYGNVIISQQGVFINKNTGDYEDDILASIYFVNGSLRYKDTDLSGSTKVISNGSFDPNQWHDLKVVVDFNQEEWSLVLDNTTILNRTMKSSINQIDSITYRTSGKRNNQLMIDDLNVYVEEVSLPPSSPVFQQMRQNYVDYLTGKNGVMAEEDFNDDNIQAYLADMDAGVSELLQSMDKSSGRTYIWQDLDRIINNGEVWPKGAGDKRSDDTKVTYQRLERLAIAYETEGSEYFMDEELKAAVIGALKWLYDNDWYSDTDNVQKGGNGWDWTMGIPNSCLTSLIVFYGDLGPTYIDHYTDTINVFSHDALNRSTGANLMWQMSKFALCEVLEEDETELQWILSHLSDIYAYVTDGDGFYDDGSFIQHGQVVNTGNYGRQLIEYTGRVLSYTKDTPWQINSDNYGANADNIYEVIGQNFEPFMYEGVLMDMVSGRHIAYSSNDNHRGYSVMKAVLGFIDAAPENYKEKYKAMMKYWIETDDQRQGDNFYTQISPYNIYKINEIMEDTSIESRGPLEGITNAAGMDRIIQRREGYGFGISMASNRVVNGEDTNKENIRGWHLGSGATYLYNADDNKFTREYWPLVDAFRIPGTTAINGEKFGIHKYNNSFAGGAVLGESHEGYGVAGMILDFSKSKLSAKKSWFMFDNEVVALGSDIDVDTAQSKSVETIIENYHIRDDGTNAVTVNGETILSVDNVDNVPVSDNSHTILDEITKDNVSWFNYEGNVAGSTVGYYFPTPTTLHMMKDKRSYSYFTINQNTGSMEQNVGNFFTVYQNHGTNPSKEKYAYVVLPNQTSGETATYASNPDIEIMTHTDKVHGVRENTLGITAANFFANETLQAGPITANKKCSVIMKEEDGILTVSVSDPTQKYNGEIDIYIDKVGEILTGNSQIDVLDDTENIHFRVNTSNARGKSFTVQFSLTE